MKFMKQMLGVVVLGAGLLGSHLVMAQGYSGLLSTFETVDGETTLVINGTSYTLAPKAAIQLRTPAGAVVSGGKAILVNDVYVQYGISSEAGTVGMVNQLLLTSPREKVLEAMDRLQ